MFFTILLLVFGILALVKGEFKITAKRNVKGSTSRILGILLLVAAAFSFLGGNWGTIALLLFVAVVVAGIASAEKIGVFKEPPIMSSTSEYPLPMDVFSFLISKLEDDGGDFATFTDQDDEKKWVQVKFHSEGADLNFSYPFNDEPDHLISRFGVSLPGEFELAAWEEQLYATFVGPKRPHMELANSVEELFTKLLRVRLSYVVKGVIEH